MGIRRLQHTLKFEDDIVQLKSCVSSLFVHSREEIKSFYVKVSQIKLSNLFMIILKVYVAFLDPCLYCHCCMQKRIK